MSRHDDIGINTSDAKPGEVLIQISHPHSNVDGRYAQLSIRDSTSGQRLIDVRLTAEQFLDLMSATSVRVQGAQLPTHPERIGKRSQNVTTSLGREAKQTPEQVRDAYLADGWESVRIDKTNFGHRVVAYRWIEDKPAEEA